MRTGGRILVGGVAIAAGAVLARAVQRSRQQRGVGLSQSIAARNTRLALIGAKTGTRHLAYRARLATSPEDTRAELEAAHQLRSAEEVAEVLGELKGGLMKVGQMMSYLDDGLPQPVRDALASLQQDAPPMAPELCNEVVRAELGDVPTRVFAEWDPIPLAAASIGQVHQAVTRNGVRVAVKVQYPGVDDAIRADLTNTDFLFRALGLLFPGLDPKPLVDELRARIVEELDYRTEADNQQLFSDYYQGHPFIHVPEVLREFSTGRVLTTELAVGSRFADVEAWSQDERDDAAESIFRFVFRSIYRLGAFNGDPHPGNYLFLPGGRVTFLDFGLVKRYTPDEVAMFENLIKAFVIDRDIQKFRRELVHYDVLRESDISDDDVRQYFGHFYEFVMDDREIEFTPEFASETIRHMFDPSSPYAHVARSSNVPPAFVITQRINLGLHAVLGRLRARRNWRRIAFELWPFTQGEPSTPLGEAEAAWLATRGGQA